MKRDIVKRELQNMAADLPEDWQEKTIQVRGNKLLEGGKKKDNQGLPIDPERLYPHLKLYKSNHFHELKEAYRKGQMPGVMAYVRSVHKRVAERIKREQEEKKQLPPLEKLFPPKF